MGGVVTVSPPHSGILHFIQNDKRPMTVDDLHPSYTFDLE